MEKVADAESFRGEDGFLKVELKEAESRGVGGLCLHVLTASVRVPATIGNMRCAVGPRWRASQLP